MGSNEVPFLCHGEDVFAKILWKNGEAVGFYSVKSKGQSLLPGESDSAIDALLILPNVWVSLLHKIIYSVFIKDEWDMKLGLA